MNQALQGNLRGKMNPETLVIYTRPRSNMVSVRWASIMESQRQ